MTISKETLALISALKNPIIDLLSDIKDEVKFYFDKGIIEYVESIRLKFIKTKTFLFRHENVDFYDIYFPITLKNKQVKNFVIDDIENLFENSNYISIIGNAGSGKSMLLKHVFLKSIMQIIRIPIVVELRNLNDFNGSFLEYLNNLLSGKKIAPNKKILERILSNGEFLFLFDGYDEIYSDNKNKITAELIEFIDNYSKNYFLITSRPGANVESLPRFDNFHVNELSIEQVKEFTSLQLKNCGDKELAEKIITIIDKPENDDYKSYLSSPLLLSMFIMTFNSYPEIPKSKSKFYWNVYDTLCTKHDSFTKHGGYQHERKTGLQNEDFENILKWFSYTSLFKGRYSFDEQYFNGLLMKIKEKLSLKCSISDLKEDLTVAISIIIVDGLDYKFPHKSLQEYFAALLIKEQNDEVKKSIYINKFDVITESTFGGGENIWNLCDEIDPIPFKKHFILRNLEAFVEKCNLENDSEKCKTFIQNGGHSFFTTIKDKKTDGCLMTQSTVASSVLAYVGINIFDINVAIHKLMWKKINDLDFFKSAFDIKKTNPKITYSFQDMTDEYQILFMNDICEKKLDKKIIKFINLTQKKIKELKDEIENHEKSNNELLEL